MFLQVGVWPQPALDWLCGHLAGTLPFFVPANDTSGGGSGGGGGDVVALGSWSGDGAALGPEEGDAEEGGAGDDFGIEEYDQRGSSVRPLPSPLDTHTHIFCARSVLSASAYFEPVRPCEAHCWSFICTQHTNTHPREGGLSCLTCCAHAFLPPAGLLLKVGGPPGPPIGSFLGMSVGGGRASEFGEASPARPSVDHRCVAWRVVPW